MLTSTLFSITSLFF